MEKHVSFIEACRQEEPPHLPANIRLFRQAILIVLEHPDCPEKEGIVNEIRVDVEDKYFKEEINMEHRQMLLGLLDL